jgi:hypothetical protein
MRGAAITIDPAKYPVGVPGCLEPVTFNSVTTTGTTTGTTTTRAERSYLDQSLDQQFDDFPGVTDPPPPCNGPSKVFANPTPPDRLFVGPRSATAGARHERSLLERSPGVGPDLRQPRGYTNPVWIKVELHESLRMRFGHLGGGNRDGGSGGTEERPLTRRADQLAGT